MQVFFVASNLPGLKFAGFGFKPTEAVWVTETDLWLSIFMKTKTYWTSQTVLLAQLILAVGIYVHKQ